MIQRRIFAALAASVLVLYGRSSFAQQVQRDVLAGRVTGASGPVAGATISITSVGSTSDLARGVARTDTEGRWLIAIQEGTGDYRIRVTAIGMSPVNTTAKRGEPRRPIIVEIRMEPTAVALDAVRVLESRRPRPPREIMAEDRAGSNKQTDTFGGSIASADQGNLAAMAATVPGVMLMADASGGPTAFSVFGLSSDQNRITLNGLSFGGGDLPRDAVVTTRVSSATYDVARGGFSGGQLSVSATPGNNFSTRLVHVTIDQPALQATDAVGRRLGTPYTNTQISGAALGPIVLDRVFYNVSIQAGRRSSDLQTLLSNNDLASQPVGVAADSVARLVSILGSSGVPVSSSRIPVNRLTENMSMLGRFDWAPQTDRVGNLVVSARRTRTQGSLLGPTAFPSHGGDVTASGADAIATFSAYRGSYLNDLRIGMRVASTTSTPYALLPDARVLVLSTLDDSSRGAATLLFGGNPALPRSTRSTGIQLYDVLSWFSIDRRHRVRTTVDLRGDGLSQDVVVNRRGTFIYNSIAEVAAERPAAFTRTLGDNRARVRALSGALSIGDDWRRGERSQFLYGLRLDANSGLTRPAYNQAIDQTFGARTDHVPRLVDVSPRFGFFRAFGSNGTVGIPGFGAPFGSVRGGIGLFRNDLPATLLAPATLLTGLSSGVRDILCIGDNVPRPAWSEFAADPSSIPAQCSGASPSTPFAARQPNVWMIDDGFRPQRSWRANLALNTFLVPKLVRATVEGVFSLNLHQQSPGDLNFAGVERFSLPDEAGRPVFVAPSSIVPATGALTSRDSRRDPQFAAVTSLGSDLRSTTRQLVFTVFPAPGDQLGRFTHWQAAYVFQRIEEQGRGFNGSTGGDPFRVEWARGALDARHQFTVSFSSRVGTLLSIATTARFASGTPFTPMVGGDINGDGLANDRAFVFSPQTADSAVASGMRRLFADAPNRVRACLQRQLERVAARASCEGPWTATMNALVNLNPERLGWQNRAQISLSLTNVPAGLDALLHSSSRLHGWGQPASSDPTLLYARGFDASANRFRYEVNSRFGDTRPSRTSIRSPFLVTLEARVQLGRDYTRQAIEQTLAPGRTRPGDKLSEPQLKQRLLTAVFNPVRGLLQAKDSLSVLTNDQLRALTQLDRLVSLREDSVVAPVARYLASLPQRYNETEVHDRVLAMAGALFDIVVDGMKTARQIFTPEQIAEFPPFLRSSFNLKRLMAARPTAGFDVDY